MTTATTLLHVRERGPDEVERAVEAIFAREERDSVLRLRGTYSAVLARLASEQLEAAYRYLVLRPGEGSAWTPLVELGNRAEGLDRALSEALGGADVFSIFVYGDAVSGYRFVRAGAEVDRYLSDPEYMASLRTEETDDAEETAAADRGAAGDGPDPAVERERGRPERFTDLLPEGTSPEAFARIVLRPGWWEEHEPGRGGGSAAGGSGHEGERDDEELVDEVDRARCIGLALELWGPSAYPFAGELEEIANTEAGPAIALGFK